MARKTSYLSYNMTTADANNQDGLVPFGRQWDFIGDVETEQMILNDGDESLCLGYRDCKIYENAYVGDMMEYKIIDGTLSMGEEWVEFYADENSVLDAVLGTFYIEQ